jgi:hypothetical protein
VSRKTINDVIINKANAALKGVLLILDKMTDYPFATPK